MKIKEMFILVMENTREYDLITKDCKKVKENCFENGRIYYKKEKLQKIAFDRYRGLFKVEK